MTLMECQGTGGMIKMIQWNFKLTLKTTLKESKSGFKKKGGGGP